MSVRKIKKICSYVIRTLLVFSVLNSCQKSVSEDLDDDTPIPPVISDLNCLPTKIQITDQDGETYSTNYFYSNTGNPENCTENSPDGSVFDWTMKPGSRRIDLIYNQWIEFDDSGRVSKSRMLFIPYDNDPYSTAYFDSYTYDTQGYIVSVRTVRDPNPLVTYLDSSLTLTTNTWDNGNLVKSKTVYLDGRSTEIDFTYNLSVTSTGNEVLIDSYVSALFPGFFNTGKGNRNLKTGMTYKFREPDGSIWSGGTESYTNHTFDGQGNVLSYKVGSVSDGNSDTSTVSKSYRCF
ncbi:MAG: hypothetical protein EOO02_02475 [Chitinophagaceae bacterium]|nr:MAG: hypothetical protein EOO02_02475 [Chitinophagaceae bacterium]